MSVVVSDHVEELDARIAAYPELLLLGQQWDPESGVIQFADGEDSTRCTTTPSEISLSTLTASRFKLSPSFLRKAGVSRGLIDDLAKGQRFARQYETCFLSYSSKDTPFAKNLYASLEKAGVRVFWDQFDVLPGEPLREQIIEAIHQHDRLVVVLSANSMASDWVRQEIELAWYHKRDSLVPIRLCEIDEVRAWTAKHETLPDLAGLFPVLDFSAWRNKTTYAHTVTQLLRSLAGGADLRRTHREVGTPGAPLSLTAVPCTGSVMSPATGGTSLDSIAIK